MTDYFSWHYLYAPGQILRIAANYLHFFYHYFSVGLLVRSFLAPWKRQRIKKEKPGFSFSDFFNILSFNLISRSIGAIIRGTVLIFWLLVEILALLFFFGFFLAWLILPGFTLPLFLSLRIKPDPAVKLMEKGVDNPREILRFLTATEMGQFLFPRLGISPPELTVLLAPALPPEKISLDLKKKRFTSLNLFSLLAQNWFPFKTLLSSKNVDEEDVLAVCHWFQREKEEKQRKAHFWEPENLLATPGVGKGWAYGYTPYLDQYTEDLTQPTPFSHHLVGREKTTDQIQRTLARTEERSVLLVGEPGVGRHTIILELAKRIKEGRVNPSLVHKRVLSLNLNQLLAESQSATAIKGLVEAILQEAAQAGNIILVIDNFDYYVSTGSGRINLTDSFIKAIDRGISLIGLTTFKDFAKYIQASQNLLNNFGKVEAAAPTPEEALVILEDTLSLYEKTEQVFVTYQALKEIINQVDQYVVDIPFPEKAIDLLDEVCVDAAQKGLSPITPQEVNQVISEKTKIPLGELKKEEAEKLAELEKVIHQRIINQEEAVVAIAKAMRRARVGIGQKERPMGSFLFLGPTGVGKTETAKALAEAYFGSEEQMIRFDMSEYQGKDALERVIGSATTTEPGLIVKAIRQNPFSLLLLDEIEKAHPEILNLFLAVLDEGYFTDAFGGKVDCRNLIIIGTSNAGTELIRERLTPPRWQSRAWSRDMTPPR